MRDPRPRAAALQRAGRIREAANVYRVAMRKGWRPLDPKLEREVLAFLADTAA